MIAQRGWPVDRGRWPTLALAWCALISTVVVLLQGGAPAGCQSMGQEAGRATALPAPIRSGAGENLAARSILIPCWAAGDGARRRPPASEAPAVPDADRALGPDTPAADPWLDAFQLLTDRVPLVRAVVAELRILLRSIGWPYP